MKPEHFPDRCCPSATRWPAAGARAWTGWAGLSALALSVLVSPAAAWAQASGLPAVPRAVAPAPAVSKGKPGVSPAALAPAVPAPEPSLLAPAPKDMGKAERPCAELDARAQEWMLGSFAILQAQMLRPNGAPKAKEAFADVWLNFKLWRDKGYDTDPYGGRVEAIYKALYPASAFAPESPFERFKEPRWACRKARAPVADKPS